MTDSARKPHNEDIVAEFSIMPRSGLTINTADYKTSNSSEIFQLRFTQIHPRKTNLIEDSIEESEIESEGRKFKIFYIRNAADSPIFVKLLRRS